MAGLADEVIVLRLTALRRPSAQRIVVPLLVLASGLMIILGKIDQVLFESLRVSVTDAAEPLLDVLSRPVSSIENLGDRIKDMANTYQDNLRLQAENRRLLLWQRTALTLASENAQLRELLKLTPEGSASFVTARVIANSGGAYVRNLLMNAGSQDGVARGQAAITGDGLVGRIYEVGTRSARLLLITDLNSRVPVVVEPSRQRAILAGDNSDRPCLLYLDPAAALKSGDRVVTSGEGGIFPPGLPVGVVDADVRGPPRIDTYVRLSQLEYVRIVDYGLAGELPNPVTAGSSTIRRAAPITAVKSNRY
jgi:rod shape-determining protein MreC